MPVKKMLPLWSYFVIDILVIALCCTSFYFAYYRIPRGLDSDNIVIINPNTSKAASQESVSTGSGLSEISKEPEIASTEWAVRFADRFTDTVVSTEDTYSSPNIAIKVKQYTKGSGRSLITYYVADIYISKIECLGSGFAKDKYGVGYSEDVLSMDTRFNAMLAINGDYYGNGKSGVVIRNGVVYRANPDGSDICVLYYDGTMKTFTADAFDLEKAVQDGAYQTWTFGPALLDENGESLSSFPTSRVTPKNPRSAIGYYEPGHYCFVLVDGRDTGYSVGMTLTELSELMKELGCKAAYNLDGGKSSVMTFHDTVVNQPCGGGRPVSDCIFIKEPD